MVFSTRVLCIIAISLFASAPGALALTPLDVEKLVRKEKILPAGAQITSRVEGTDVHISTVPDKNLVDQIEKYKINAVFMAKAVMTADKNILRVVVRFYDKNETEQFTEITVRSADIKAFGSGLTTEDELLTSLQVEKGSDASKGTGATATTTTSSTAAAGGQTKPPSESAKAGAGEGPLKAERSKLNGRILSLKAQGVGVKPFLDQFAALEELAKTGSEDAVADKLEMLTDSVGEQEKALAARKAASTPKVQRPAQPIAAPAAAPAPVQATVTAPTTSPLGALLERVADLVGFDPALVPSRGAYFDQRIGIAAVLRERKMQHMNTDPGIMRLWSECQSLASAGRENETQLKVQTISQALGVPDPFRNLAWYQGRYAEIYRKLTRMRGGGGPGHHDD